jgi:hypothetical protein
MPLCVFKEAGDRGARHVAAAWASLHACTSVALLLAITSARMQWGRCGMMREPSAPDCRKQSKSRGNTRAVRNRQDTRRLDMCVVRLASCVIRALCTIQGTRHTRQERRAGATNEACATDTRLDTREKSGRDGRNGREARANKSATDRGEARATTRFSSITLLSAATLS